MNLYHPMCEVRLIKAIKRKDVTEGAPVILDRYGNLAGINLTTMLGDGCRVRVSKSVRAPAGAWSVTLADKPHGTLLETVSALIEPMDLIEIRMAHNPSDYGYKKDDRERTLPIVMRGFVSSVVRNETISGGRPMRTVTVSGQDLGKVLSLIHIWYHNNSVVGDNIISELAFFQKYFGGSSPKIQQANEFIQEAADKVINPYMQRITKLADGESIGAKVANQLLLDVGIRGSVDPYLVSSFKDVTLHSMLSTIMDVGPFNELFVEDREDAPYLVVRPNPFMAVGGGYVQADAWSSAALVDADDVESMSLSRSDAGVANYFWVTNRRWAMMQNETIREMAMQGSAPFVLFDRFNCSMSHYGVRKMEVEASLGHPSYSHSDSAKEQLVKTDTQYLGEWVDDRRRILAESNKDNVVFQSGTIHLRGNEKIKAGMYVDVTRGSATASFYAVSVDHDYVPFSGFFTTVTAERGTDFIERSKRAGAPFYAEMTAQGIH